MLFTAQLKIGSLVKKKMNLIFFFVMVAWSARASFIKNNLMEAWTGYKVKFHKFYTTVEEDRKRMMIFKENRQFVAEHNLKYLAGEVTYDVGINQFSDMLPEELKPSYRGETEDKNEKIFVPPDDVVVPDEINWVEKGAVTPVRDQKTCKAGYAFSAVATMEGRNFIITNKLLTLSPQMMVDCALLRGCEFGVPEQCFEAAQEEGIVLDKCYPYVAETDSLCAYDVNCIALNVSEYYVGVKKNETLLKTWVSQGPVAAHINGGLKDFVHYKSGIYSNKNCSSAACDTEHAVAVVGYGTDPTTKMDYWLLKNSWGTTWGKNGYMKLARNQGNVCGVATRPSYPVIKT